MLTKKQGQILSFLREAVGLNGQMPTLREMARAQGISHITVRQHLMALVRQGYLEYDSYRHRGISLKNATPEIRLPILGRIRAGVPILAQEEIEGYLSIPQSMMKGREGFILRVVGDSMIEKDIREGDYAIIRPQQTAQNGDIVAALRDNEATLKTYRVREEGIFLEPANPNYCPMAIAGFEIIGKFIGTIRLLSFC